MAIPQTTLAEWIGCPYKTYQNWRYDRKQMPRKAMERVRTLFGISIADSAIGGAK
jgi:hypothetical protein